MASGTTVKDRLANVERYTGFPVTAKALGRAKRFAARMGDSASGHYAQAVLTYLQEGGLVPKRGSLDAGYATETVLSLHRLLRD